MTKRGQPTAAQVRVMRTMKDGTVLVRGYVNSVSWYLQGSGAPVHTGTADAVRRAGWVAAQDFRHYVITQSGLAALGSAVLVEEE